MLLALSVYLSSAAAASERMAFDKGVRLFSTGEYEKAAALFEQVLASDRMNAIVHYNLGSSYYKLGRYELAREQFREIKANHKLAPLAYYNLGLIAFRLEGKEAALRWFHKSMEASDDDSLRLLAAKQIARLEEKTSSPEAHSRGIRLSGYFSVGAGYDDNVARVPDGVLQISNQRSKLLDLFLSTTYWMNGNHHRGNALKFNAGATRYDQLAEYDSTLLGFGLYHYRPLIGWHSRWSLHFSHSELHGDAFQQRLRFQVRTGKRYSANQWLRLQYEYSQIKELNAAYSYLGGNQQRIRVENRTRLNHARLRAGYLLEWNDREDYRGADTFSSYSPVRHTAYLWYKPAFGEKWAGRLGLEYRYSDYIEENVAAGIPEGTREDRRLRITLGTLYKLSPDYELEISLRRTENDSNFTRRDYISNQLMISVGGYF